VCFVTCCFWLSGAYLFFTLRFVCKFDTERQKSQYHEGEKDSKRVAWQKIILNISIVATISHFPVRRASGIKIFHELLSSFGKLYALCYRKNLTVKTCQRVMPSPGFSTSCATAFTQSISFPCVNRCEHICFCLIVIAGSSARLP